MTSPRFRLLPLALGAVLLASCGMAQERRTYELRVFSPAPSAGPNAEGWTVTLDRAEVNIGPVRFYEGRVEHARFSPLEWIIGAAWAHPGHFHPGEAMGEWLDVRTVDLLGGNASLGTVNGVTGAYGSIVLTLPAGEAGHSVLLSGVASRAGAADVPFELTVTLEEDLPPLRFETEIDSAPGYVELEIDLGGWLRGVDFTDAATPGGQAHNALTRAVRDAGNYQARWIRAGTR